MNTLAITVLALVVSQPQAPPLEGPPQAPPVQTAYTYSEGMREAKSSGKRMVVFVGTPARDIQGCVVSQSKHLTGYPEQCIIVTTPGGENWHATLYEDATDAQILAIMQPKEVRSNRPAPFQQSDPQTADVEKVDARVASKVDKDARFYNLRPLYQNMYTMSSRPFVNYEDIRDLEHHPFLVSGGMQGLKGWRSEKALMIPKGEKIKVWQQYEEVRAFAPTIRYRWQFPTGTIAYDVLSTDKGVFEVRTQTRDEDGWQTKVTFKDEQARPEGYTGLSQSCASCHNRTGEIVDVPGRIYRRERWGSDGRFSWRPYDEFGILDKSWPLEVK